MPHKLILKPRAERHFYEIYDYIFEKTKGGQAAKKFTDEINAFLYKLTLFPYVGTKRDDLGENLRVVGYKRRVTVVFTANETDIVIYAILYGGRDLEKGLGND